MVLSDLEQMIERCFFSREIFQITRPIKDAGGYLFLEISTRGPRDFNSEKFSQLVMVESLNLMRRENWTRFYKIFVMRSRSYVVVFITRSEYPTRNDLEARYCEVV